MAVTDILSKEEIENMSLRVVEHGGFISYKDNGDGTVGPYELNITWYSALNREDSYEPVEIQLKRYLASRSIALAFIGVPGVYVHGFLGSRNDVDAVLEEKQIRSINRRTIKKDELIKALTDQNSNIYRVSSGMIDFIRLRLHEKAFHPNAKQRVLAVSDLVFTILRISIDEKEQILAITNVTGKHQEITINIKQQKLLSLTWVDLLTKKMIKANNDELRLSLGPYDVFWLKASL
jgi:sucrose phosphorylase